MNGRSTSISRHLSRDYHTSYLIRRLFLHRLLSAFSEHVSLRAIPVEGDRRNNRDLQLLRNALRRVRHRIRDLFVTVATDRLRVRLRLKLRFLYEFRSNERNYVVCVTGE